MHKVKEIRETSTRAAWVKPTLSKLDLGQTLSGTIPQVEEGLIKSSNPQVFGFS